ncbi:MAG TPA: hypothetical protein VFD88_04025, partial [Clostridia bacterium]|nr:hypothetical protein [Clostridia bacterium]
PTDVHIWNSITGGPNDPATRANVIEHDVLTSGLLAIPPPAQLFNSGVASTAANNVVSTLTMPANYPWRVGDKIRFRVAGQFTGANNVKNVGIADGVGVLYLLTVAAGIQSAFVIEGWIEVINATNPGNPITYRITGLSISGATPTALAITSSNPASNVAVPFTVQAWVINASDQVYIVAAEMQFSRVDDSLSAAATDSRS